MKVVHVVPSIQDESAGTSYCIPSLVEAISLNAVDLELHFLDDIPAHIKKTSYDVVNYPRHDVVNLGWSPEMYKGLKKVCEIADIIHNNGLWMMPNVYPYWASKETKCKLVVQPHGTLSPWALNRSKWKKRVFWWLWQRKVLKYADMFIATSEREYEEIRALGYNQPIAIVPIGMDIPQGNASVDQKG
jgi:glycosyltransferase involved in cell wall biosynthesis